MKREHFLILVIFLLFSSFSFVTSTQSDHAIYLSVVEIVQSSNPEIANIRIKVFTNDIEDAIRNQSGQLIQLSDLLICENRKFTIESYFGSHFQISINESSADLFLISCEEAVDATWFNFRINCPAQWKQINIKANFLMELFPTQANVISVQKGSDKRFIRLTNSKSSELVKF